MMLAGADGIDVVGEAGDGDEVGMATDAHQPHVVLMDIRMPRVDNSVQERARAALGKLSEREQEVALAVARGGSNADIASELYMSVATVKSHISSIFTKLGLDNRTQIALLAHDAGRI